MSDTAVYVFFADEDQCREWNAQLSALEVDSVIEGPYEFIVESANPNTEAVH
jgi:hypothetical protein